MLHLVTKAGENEREGWSCRRDTPSVKHERLHTEDVNMLGYHVSETLNREANYVQVQHLKI